VTVREARVARPTDIARMAEIFREASSELGALRGGAVFVAREARAEPVERSLAATLSEPDACAWVGTIDDIVVGYAAARVEPLRDGSRLGVVTDLYVESGARAVGVGECLVSSVVAWCSAEGCKGVDAAALPGNRAAKNFFEESGFTARLLVMHHRVGDG
jgi:GNAT superfamily N-acetyltransferase